MTEDFTKTVRVGTLPDVGNVYCEIRYENGELSITGTEGPKANGDARGSSGQIVGGYAHRNPADDDARYSAPTPAEAFTFAPGWDAETWLRFVDVWEAWHLNKMRAGCEHQRAERWQDRPIDPAKPTTAYGRHFPGQAHDSWNMLAWVRPGEHPEGLLTKPCPTCGYKYGTEWLSETVPDDVLEFLIDLPHADRTPAWV